MNIHLRVREADAVGVKFTLDTLEDIPVDVLQIAAFAPHAHHEVHRRGAEFVQTNGHFPIAQNSIVRFDNRGQQLLYLVDISIVSDADNKLIATRRLPGEVNDIAGDDFPVRDHHYFTVRGTQGGGENLHVQHRTCHAAKVDILASAERAEHHQQYACGKVRQRSLQR